MSSGDCSDRSQLGFARMCHHATLEQQAPGLWHDHLGIDSFIADTRLDAIGEAKRSSPGYGIISVDMFIGSPEAVAKSRMINIGSV